MNDIEVRIECVKAAVATVGNPNHVQQAREYYAFVTENSPANAPAVEQAAEEVPATDDTNSEDLSASQQVRVSKKGKSK